MESENHTSGVPNLFWPKVYFQLAKLSEVYQNQAVVGEGGSGLENLTNLLQHFYLLSHN